MRILVVGAGQTGAQVLAQLKKNPRLTVLTLDPRENPYAVRQKIIEEVDIDEALTPLTLADVMERTHPDLILLTTTSEDMGLGTVPGIEVLTSALREELAALAEVPVIQVSRAGSH